jgi:hypothetical protein
MLIKLKLRGKAVGFAGKKEQEINFEGETIKDLVEILAIKFGVGVKQWQSSLLVNGNAVQNSAFRLRQGDTVTVTVYPIIGGG